MDTYIRFLYEFLKVFFDGLGMIFGGIVKESLLSPAVLVWRFITYYLGVLIGGVALGFFKVKGSEK